MKEVIDGQGNYFEVGEYFTHSNEMYKTVANTSYGSCEHCDAEGRICDNMHCIPPDRDDNTDVFYILVDTQPFDYDNS